MRSTVRLRVEHRNGGRKGGTRKWVPWFPSLPFGERNALESISELDFSSLLNASRSIPSEKTWFFQFRVRGNGSSFETLKPSSLFMNSASPDRYPLGEFLYLFCFQPFN